MSATMTDDQIIEWARELFAGGTYIGPSLPNLRAFARLVRNQALEDVCRVVWAQCGSDNAAQRTVDAIRAMKEK